MLDQRAMIGRERDFRYIRIDQIDSDTYQRPISESQVAKMLAKYDPMEMLAIVTSERDGRFYVLDGHHRIEVERRLGHAVIYADVRHGMTYTEEASLFARMNSNSRGLSPMDKFHARLESDDRAAHRLFDMVAASGFHVAMTSGDKRGIRAIAALELLQAWGQLEDVLGTFFETWPDEGFHSKRLLGLATFLRTYDEQSAYDHVRLVKVLRATPSGVLDRSARELHFKTGMTDVRGKLFALALRDIYNTGTRKKLTGEPIDTQGKRLPRMRKAHNEAR